MDPKFDQLFLGNKKFKFDCEEIILAGVFKLICVFHVSTLDMNNNTYTCDLIKWSIIGTWGVSQIFIEYVTALCVSGQLRFLVFARWLSDMHLSALAFQLMSYLEPRTMCFYSCMVHNSEYLVW